MAGTFLGMAMVAALTAAVMLLALTDTTSRAERAYARSPWSWSVTLPSGLTLAGTARGEEATVIVPRPPDGCSWQVRPQGRVEGDVRLHVWRYEPYVELVSIPR